MSENSHKLTVQGVKLVKTSGNAKVRWEEKEYGSDVEVRGFAASSFRNFDPTVARGTLETGLAFRDIHSRHF